MIASSLKRKLHWYSLTQNSGKAKPVSSYIRKRGTYKELEKDSKINFRKRYVKLEQQKDNTR